MSKKSHIARHRAVPTRINPLTTASRAVTASASVAGKPAAVVAAASGLMFGAALPASAAGEINIESAPVQQAVTAAPAGTYTVQLGDTLGSIAYAHGVSLDVLFTANNLGYASIIYPGQVISLGGAAAPQQFSAQSAPVVAAPVVTAPVAVVTAPVAAQVAPVTTQMAPVTEQVAPVTTQMAPAVTTQMAPAVTTTYNQPEPKVSFQSTPSNGAQGIVGTAMQGEGSGYVYGGTSAGGWDCSGFVQSVYAQNGISLPRTTWAQFASMNPTSSPQPGDLVSQNGGSHVGIYLGDGQMISALNPSQGTTVHSVDAMSVDGYYTR